ncbi:MAG: hypothetical protein K0M55_12005 [Rhizobium sp.]|nr:hypothetical protein [Rhizobium sp.]
MEHGQDTHLGLLGLAPGGDGWRGAESGLESGAEGGGESGPVAEAGAAADAAALEQKSAEGLSPLDRLAALLDDLTGEMRQQFELFRKLRATAERQIDGADEAAAKAARADAKAATDAIALIVRTLEKIDSLQRQLARDREDAALLSGEGEDEEAIRQELLRIIENQAEARARARFAAWQCQAAPGGAGAAADQPEPEATPGARSG